MDLELESKSVMIYINEETVNKLKEYPFIEEKDPITGEWTTATVTVEGMDNKKPEEEEKEEELEYTEEEIHYNKIDDVMFNKKCLNTEIEKVVKMGEGDEVDGKPKGEEKEEELEYTEEEIHYNKIDDVMFNKKCLNTEIEKVVKMGEGDEVDGKPKGDEEIYKINKNLKHHQEIFINRDDDETTWDMPKDYNAELRNILFYFCIFFMLCKWINKLISVEEPKCVK